MPRQLRVEYPGAIYHIMPMARRSRRDTTLTIREIAQRLRQGSWKSLNNKPYLVGEGRRTERKSEKATK